MRTNILLEPLRELSTAKITKNVRHYAKIMWNDMRARDREGRSGDEEHETLKLKGTL